MGFSRSQKPSSELGGPPFSELETSIFHWRMLGRGWFPKLPMRKLRDRYSLPRWFDNELSAWFIPMIFRCWFVWYSNDKNSCWLLKTFKWWLKKHQFLLQSIVHDDSFDSTHTHTSCPSFLIWKQQADGPMAEICWDLHRIQLCFEGTTHGEVVSLLVRTECQESDQPPPTRQSVVRSDLQWEVRIGIE